MSQTGTVKFFNATKGFGFITAGRRRQGCVRSHLAIEKSGMHTLVDGQKVSFDVEPDRMGKGPKAVNLRSALIASGRYEFEGPALSAGLFRLSRKPWHLRQKFLLLQKRK